MYFSGTAPQYRESEELSRRQRQLAHAMAGLSPRERDVIAERRLKDDPTTLEDLSTKYNISRERIRQIEVRAFEKLQKAMKGLALEDERRARDARMIEQPRALAAPKADGAASR